MQIAVLTKYMVIVRSMHLHGVEQDAVQMEDTVAVTEDIVAVTEDIVAVTEVSKI